MMFTSTVVEHSLKGLLDTSIPEPPVCAFDCAMFDLVTTGEVDDCAVTHGWTGHSCLDDCSGDEVGTMSEIASFFCYQSRSLSDGSYSSHNSIACEDSSNWVDDDNTQWCLRAELEMEFFFNTTSCVVYTDGFTDSYDEFVSAYSNMATYCPDLCDTCDGFTIEPDPCAACIPSADACFVDGVFQESLAAVGCEGARTCAPCYALPGPCDAACIAAAACFIDGVFQDDIALCAGADGCASCYVDDPCDAACIPAADACFVDGVFQEDLAALGCESARSCASCYLPPPDPCVACIPAADACFVDGVFQEDLAAFGCEEARGCAPCYAVVDDEDDEDDECVELCSGEPEDCDAFAASVMLGGCANTCTEEFLQPFNDVLECGFDIGDLKSEGDCVENCKDIAIVLSVGYDEEQSPDEITETCEYIVSGVFADTGLTPTCDMVLVSGGRRRLLIAAFEYDITLTFSVSEDDEIDLDEAQEMADIVGGLDVLSEATVTLMTFQVGDETPIDVDTRPPTPDPTTIPESSSTKAIPSFIALTYAFVFMLAI